MFVYVIVFSVVMRVQRYIILFKYNNKNYDKMSLKNNDAPFGTKCAW